MNRILFFLICFLSRQAYAQFQIESTFFGETSTNMRAISVGNVTNPNQILARFHLNNFRCNSPALVPFNGSLFRTDGDQSVVNRWQLFTGTTADAQTERFRLYSDIGTTPFIGLQSLSNGLRFETAGAFPRMRINGTSTANVNGFNIDNTGFTALVSNQVFWTDPLSEKNPFSLLHLAGSGGNYSESSYRPWMRDGIVFTFHGDLAYIGPRNLGQEDRNEFVIQWSDNANVDPFGPDDLVFRFTRGAGTDPAGGGSLEGLEVMRCTGESGVGRVGIGDEFSDLAGFRPQRRLHVHDPGTNNDANAQLRLSQNFATTFTDFRTTTQGNLYLNMTGTQQRVGIEEQNPLERLDVAGNARFQTIPVISPNCVILGQQIGGNPSDNRLTRLDFNGNASTYLAGNGTWQTISGGACDWNLTNAQDLTTGYPGACREGNVAIGESQIFADTKLRVVNAGSTPFVYGQRNRSTGASNTGVGIESFAVGQSAAWVAGVQGTGTGSASKNFGGYFEGIAPNDGNSAAGCVGISVAPVCTSENVGVLGIASFSQNLFGIRGNVQAGACTENMYAVYGEITGTASNQNWAVYANGPAGGTTFWNPSDEQLKENIQPIEGALNTLMALQPSSYYFRANEYPQLALPSDQHFGLLASNLEEVMPTLVRQAHVPARHDLDGNTVAEALDFKMVNYTELIPVLIKSVQEQQQQISQLTAMVQECCGFDAAARSASETESETMESDVTLSDEGNIILNQNVPNPFAERTTIDYEINQSFEKAQILFHDQHGKLIQVSEITQTGKGRLNVFADDLSSGTYTYSIVVDGKIISSKKMVKQ
jgi:hypothetical protein